MKKIVLLIIISAALGHSGRAQSFSLSNASGPIPNNSTMYASGGFSQIDVVAWITNNSPEDKNVILRKVYVDVIPNTSNYYCWGVCWPPTAMTAGAAVLIPAGYTDMLNFAAHYECLGNAGTSSIRYVFYDEANPSDSVCFNVHYTGCMVGIEEASGQSGLQLMPNPANEGLNLSWTIAAEDLPGALIEVYTATGGLIITLALNTPNGITRLSTTSLPAGMYFVVIRNSGGILRQDKLQIVH